MAVFEFYGDADDCDAAAAAVLTGSNYLLLPNICYERSAAIEIKSPSAEFATYLNINRTMFIAGPFTRGLSWQKLSKGRWAGHYVIRPEYEGPLISIRFPAVADRGDVTTYSAGMIDLRARAYAPTLGIEVPATNEAKTAFRDVIAKVKSVCCRVEVGAEKAWVGRSLFNRASLATAPRLIVNGLAVPLLRT